MNFIKSMISYLDSVLPVRNTKSHFPECLRFYFLITELIQICVLGFFGIFRILLFFVYFKMLFQTVMA